MNYSRDKESYYGSPPQLFVNEIAGVATSSRPYPLKYGDPLPPRRPDFIVRWSFAHKNICEDCIFRSILPRVEQRHETFVKENRWFSGGRLS